jgi:hypothetical protein
MTSMERLTNLLSEAKDAKLERLIFEIYALVKDEVREEVKQIQEEINIITLINGRRADLSELRNSIKDIVMKELDNIK